MTRHANSRYHIAYASNLPQNEAMIDTHLDNFERDVIEASRQTPVLVDFWAPWCGPCRVLGPLLEKLEAEYDGRWRLVKINSDENPTLATQFGVRSIPFVAAFGDGRMIDQFVGALPEGQLRAFIERVVPAPAETARRRAQIALAHGDRAAAHEALLAALALDAGHDEARLDLIELLLSENRIDEARAQVALLSPQVANAFDARYVAIQTRLDALAQADALPDAGVLQARVDAHPDDLQARLDLANLHLAAQRYEQALRQLLEIVKRDRGFQDDAARKTMLSIFSLIDDPGIVSTWRRELSRALN